MQTTTATSVAPADGGSVASDSQRDSSLSALKLSEIALEPVATSDSVTARATYSVDGQFATAESKLSRLPHESDLSASPSTQRRRMENVQSEQPSAAAELAKTDAAEPDVTTSKARSRPVGIIYQSSLPDLVDSREDKDSASTVVSTVFFPLSVLSLLSFPLGGRVATVRVCWV